jgi:hypothetical protein
LRNTERHKPVADSASMEIAQGMQNTLHLDGQNAACCADSP